MRAKLKSDHSPGVQQRQRQTMGLGGTQRRSTNTNGDSWTGRSDRL